MARRLGFPVPTSLRHASGAGRSRASAAASATSGSGSWMLASGHFEPAAFPLTTIYPLASSSAAARHRHAYPDMRYEVPVGIRGGAWPFRYQLIAGPGWLTVERETLTPHVPSGTQRPEPGYGWVSGVAPTTGGPWSVTVRVTDQEGSFVDVSWTIALSTSAFVFVDGVAGDDATGNGSLGSPYRSAKGVKDAGTHQDKIGVILGTSYTIDWANGGADQRLDTGRTGTPSAWVVEDRLTRVQVNASSANRVCDPGGADGFLCGLQINDCAQTATSPPANTRVVSFPTGTHRFTLAACGFDNPFIGTANTDNPACLFTTGTTGAGGRHTFLYMCDVEGTNLPGSGASGNGLSLYTLFDVDDFCIERFVAVAAWRHPSQPKDTCRRGTMRWGYSDGPDRGGLSINGQNNGVTTDEDLEVCWCRLVGHGTGTNQAALNFGTQTTGERTQLENIHFYRNSVRWHINNRLSTDGDYGQVHATANVVVGQMVGNFDTDVRNVLDPSNVAFTNVPGDPNTDMLLTGSFRTAHLGTAGAEVA